MTSNQPWWLTMPPAELAATILPLFSYSAQQSDQTAMRSIVNWCKTGTYSAPFTFSTNPFGDPDYRAVAEAMQVLEHADLLMRWIDFVGLTRLGMHALQTNTVRQHLGLGEAPPTT